MKRINILIIGIIVAGATTFTGCKKDDKDEDLAANVLPSNFKVDIPDAISYTSGGKRAGGGEIYQNLATFIAIGEGASDVVQAIMWGIAVYNINQAMTLSYTSDEDGRTKDLVVVEGATYGGTTYGFKLTISDAQNSGNADGGIGMQIFWNTSPIKGMALLKPFNIDVTANTAYPDLMYSIEYSEDGSMGYDAHMIVELDGLPLGGDIYAISTLKMFAGKTGNTVDVYGNSEHPNAYFLDPAGTPGFDWAFVASGNQSTDIGVAEVGLPSNLLNSSDRIALLETNSIYNVFYNEVLTVWPGADSTDIAGYLVNTQSPGYFDANGFVQAGISPGNEHTTLENRLTALSPYNPKDINELTITFQ